MEKLFEKIDSEIKSNLNSLVDTKNWNTYRGVFANSIEKRLNNFFSAKSLLTNSGSSTIELCLRVLNIGRGDEVIIPSFTFVATAQAVLMVGATPVLCQTDDSFNLSANELEKKINKKTRAVIFVHLFGNPTGIEEVKKICDKNGLYLVEDCAQGFGAAIGNKKAGTFGDCSAFSFNSCKHFSCGDGGLFLTKSEKLFIKAKGIRHAGLIEKNKDFISYLIGGKNLMTEFQAAVLLPQIKRIDTIIDDRIKNGSMITNKLSQINGIQTQKCEKNATHVFQRIVFLAENQNKAKKIIANNELIERVYPRALSEEPIIKKFGLIDEKTRNIGLDFWKRHASITFLPFVDYKNFVNAFELK
ncbi:MAG: aminotransferase class I/II-fold pyridoxal phosphate-dependent enzyme [Candidatus ainarchaeum sp.]|nr:aminotransferase class I/II-fold pyridoxal phosphate-dependent enzyme [Candidatus ainarchaeum sp.]